MFNDCSKCGELWREFADATARHITAEKKLECAVLECDYDAIRALREQAQASFDQKTKILESVRKHDAVVHGVAPRAF